MPWTSASPVSPRAAFTSLTDSQRRHQIEDLLQLLRLRSLQGRFVASADTADALAKHTWSVSPSVTGSS
ncbi:hypothetical protein NFX46_18320 [Streptomyces phaeoluteigriseus]|uniref:Uncharacterized protein n=1 Tax=Streptomyces phaeoluteigriseus TaxID=114686 RepID=A0ABY4Z9E3_9ACTN|nr:hypothetical protein [Streptomyces phaeoluteigriseus]USQ85555.1 hypothetical protein NFX46_18320 [Streptomyces phaeoluteigriseus]